LFVVPPRLPKLNGAVERAHHAHPAKFYEVTPHSFQIAQLNQELREWERIYNTVPPLTRPGASVLNQKLFS
jgi:transposase InsO family protein